MHPSDDALVAAFQTGDEGALGALLDRHLPAVYRFALKMCRDPEDAKDVAQETLLAAARGLRDFRGASSVSTWLFAIARSFCLKKRRRRIGAPQELLSLDSDEARRIETETTPPDEAAGDRQVAQALDAAIGDLEPMYREVLVLRDVEGLTAPAVAQVLGMGVDAVKSRLHRARLMVREKLAPLLQPGQEAAPSGCPDIVPIFSRYLEDAIGPDECARMQSHVEACARCHKTCDALKRTLVLCQAKAQEGTVPADVQALVRKALAEFASTRQR